MISRDNRQPNDGVVPCPNVGDSREADHARNGPGSCDRCCEHVRRLDGATPCSPLHGVAPVDIGRGVVLEAIGWTGPVQPFFIPLLDGAPGRTRAPVKQTGRPARLVRRTRRQCTGSSALTPVFSREDKLSSGSVGRRAREDSIDFVHDYRTLEYEPSRVLPGERLALALRVMLLSLRKVADGPPIRDESVDEGSHRP